MSKKKTTGAFGRLSGGLVYSTNPDHPREEESGEVTPAPAAQRLIVRMEWRSGKAVTLVIGFAGKAEELEALGKQLRNYCGTGGGAKSGEIMVQGDQREKVLRRLLELGYSKSRKV